MVLITDHVGLLVQVDDSSKVLVQRETGVCIGLPLSLKTRKDRAEFYSFFSLIVIFVFSALVRCENRKSASRICEVQHAAVIICWLTHIVDRTSCC